MRKCIYILWQKCMPSKKEAKAVSGRLWDWCKILYNYEVNVDSTSIGNEQDSEWIFSILRLIKWGPGNCLGKSLSGKATHSQEKQGRYCHYCNSQASYIIMLSGRHLLERDLENMFYVYLNCQRHYLRRKKEVLEWRQVQEIRHSP